MKRILLSAAILIAAGAFLVLGTGAKNQSADGTYKIELDNAFGLTSGADFKVAGVKAGSINKIDLPQKCVNGDVTQCHALVTVQVSQPGLGSFRSDAFCQSRPQSLIGEYFVECQPGTQGRVLKPGSTIPVNHTQSTIPADLLANIMRMPYRERFTLIINELGAAVAGRSADLAAALRRAVPALTETDNLLNLLVNDSNTLQQLTSNSDQVITALANNTGAITRFIDEANRAAIHTANQQVALRGSLQRLPAFLEQLRPSLQQLGAATDANLPVLVNLNNAAEQVNRLHGSARLLPLGAAGDQVAGPGFGHRQDGGPGGHADDHAPQPVRQAHAALDPKTRHAFQQWQQDLAKSIAGNDQNLNSVLGNLPTFAADATDILRVLDVEHAAVVPLLQNGRTVFAAISQDPAALRNLITSGETTFATTAANNNALADTFHVFPTFENETKLTLRKLKTFALNTDPLVRELNPVAAQLGPTLRAVRALSPDLRRLFVNLGPLITVSKTGLPAIRDVLKGAPPLLNQLGPFLSELNPIINWLGLHQQLISDFISNGAGGISAETISVGGSGTGHYLRQYSPVGAETLGFYPNRDPNNRGNRYPPPLWLADPNNLKNGNFPSWDGKNSQTGGGVAAKPGLGPIGQVEACWVAPTLPGANAGQIPHILKKNYPSK